MMLKLQRNFSMILSFLCFIIAQDPIVNLPQGRIVGTKVYTDKSLLPIEIYYGIPYATPPIGRHRFLAPERHTGWRRTLYTNRLPPHCPHTGGITSSEMRNYSEDCLFLNIWTPRPAHGKPLPVLVILYSESWIRGGVSLPCQDLAAEDIVVVTVGYRIHLLGLFTLASITARGNLALLDQYLAFLWIRDNIAAFGGDPNAITVLGHSAGANSILHHLVSPRSSGLFQKAIIMSPIDIWNVIDEQKDKSYATKADNVSREVALSLGCSSKLDQEILNCMQTRPLSDILSVFSNANWNKMLQPVPETYLPESEQYLPTSLSSALSSSEKSLIKVDLLLGTTDLDALNYNDETYYELLKSNASHVLDFASNKVIPELLIMFSLYDPDVLPMLIRAIRWEYWEKDFNKGDMHEAIERLARMDTSARWGAGAALLAARLARHVTRLYAYRCSLPSNVDLEGRRINYTGGVHGSDLISLLGDSMMLQIARRPSNSEEKRYSSIFQRYVISFIRNGYPDSQSTWQQYRPGDAHIFEIRDDMNSVSGDYRASKDIKFWLKYLPEFSNLRKSEQTQHLPLEGDEGRLRGGVFAMCGVSLVLLLLLCLSAILLHRQRLRRRFSISEDVQN